MSDVQPEFKKVALVGTGAMGMGIAQICAQSGSVVYLFDTRPGAAEEAVSYTHLTLPTNREV